MPRIKRRSRRVIGVSAATARKAAVGLLLFCAACGGAPTAAVDASGCPTEAEINATLLNPPDPYLGCYKSTDSITSTGTVPRTGLTLSFVAIRHWKLERDGVPTDSGSFIRYGTFGPDFGVALDTSTRPDTPTVWDALLNGQTLDVGVPVGNPIHTGTLPVYRFVRVR